MLNLFPYRLYLVISEADCAGRDFVRVAEQAVLGGVDLVQLREKHATPDEFLRKAERLQTMLQTYHVPLIINDNLDVAVQAQAFGIHVGRSDCSPTHIRSVWKGCRSLGYSIEQLDQLETQDAQCSDCLGISPVFKTSTKTDTVTEWGLDGIRTIRHRTDKPLVAIGHINAANTGDVMRAGADCLAVVSAICQAPNPQQAAQEIRDQIDQAVR
ncbi:thiamine phosphate synthase [Pontiella sulfatireligans]|uniref:Thiamine-phosphate synthase n=1 Tax=Pontiella sulfatireligans TaxID=2750658 RepID=A0A6C2UPN4_9BACT|nr:thiamine phosphate synthase [Pontiella sulfatireligans]VGO21277.1 Thiamine-phosphate synthase [Pontiella sulfatireligans]